MMHHYCHKLILRSSGIILGLLLAVHSLAAPSLPGFFTDNMVLQRDKPVPIWGWAEPGEKISVAFAGQTLTASADAEGNWILRLAAMPASNEGRELKVTSATEPGIGLTIRNIVVGDVWLCSGQSNMEWSLGAVQNAETELAAADYPMIRHIKIGHLTGDLPANNVSGQWVICSPATASGFTAVGYFFGRKLHRELGVPVGLIGCNWGGTRIEPWTAPEGFRLVPGLASTATAVDATLPTTPSGQTAYKQALAALREWIPEAEAAVKNGTNPSPAPPLPSVGSSHQSPTRIYNAMVHPLIPFAIRGAIWYQGESNGGEGITYFHKMQALIGGWRQLWNQGEFPFYFVQLANYRQPPSSPEGGDGYSKLREAQRKSLEIPHTGMAVIIDIGEANNIHPRNKQDVGLRLALWALATEHGRKDLIFSGPLYKGHTIEGNKIRIAFDHVGSGLMVGRKEGLEPTAEDEEGSLKHFAISGATNEWHWADAAIEGETVVVSCPEVPEPVAVRYAFSGNPTGCNLYNREGLPASPFTTEE